MRGKVWMFSVGLLLIGAVSRADAQQVQLRHTPCRLFDSRHIGGTGQGPKITSATIEATLPDAGGVQGGEVSCAAPEQAVGVILNLTVYQPNSIGYARLWAFGEVEPLSTSINASAGILNEATGLVVKLGTDGRISLTSTITGAHYIIDLAGSVLPEPTTYFKGTITNKQGGPPWEIDLDTLFGSLRVVCSAPWIDPDACDTAPVFDVGDPMCGIGHIGPWFSGQAILAHAVNDCQ